MVFASPAGPAWNFSYDDIVIYDFNLSEPLTCPFNMSHCWQAFTLSFWFRWVTSFKDKYLAFFQLGPCFKLYKANHPYNKIRFRWTNYESIPWYASLVLDENTWHHVGIIWRATRITVYTDGRQMKERFTKVKPEKPLNNTVSFGSANAPTTFSIIPINIWKETKSPVLMWRLFQDGLTEFHK